MDRGLVAYGQRQLHLALNQQKQMIVDCEDRPLWRPDFLPRACNRGRSLQLTIVVWLICSIHATTVAHPISWRPLSPHGPGGPEPSFAMTKIVAPSKRMEARRREGELVEQWR